MDVTVIDRPSYCIVTVSNMANELRHLAGSDQEGFELALQELLRSILHSNGEAHLLVPVEVKSAPPNDECFRDGRNIVIELYVGPTHKLASGLDLDRFYYGMLIPELRRYFSRRRIANVRLRIVLTLYTSMDVNF